jgi:hypothetical protein
MRQPQPLGLAIRVFPQSARSRRKRPRLKRWRRPHQLLAFDCEAQPDTALALTFGCYRYYEHGVCLEEGLFYGDDLPEADRSVLADYVKDQVADTDPHRGVAQLRLLSRRAFLEKLYTVACKTRGLVVGFNLPFDLSRLAIGFGTARGGRFSGGFSLLLWEYQDERGDWHIDKYRPRIVIKHIDSKRALKGLTATKDPDYVDLIPDGSKTGKPDRSKKFRGHLLDLRTLAFVLTDRGHTLASACKTFGVEHSKLAVEQHGIVTPDYIDYNRRDVLATAELAFKALEEYDRFNVPLQETQAYSPASLGKAHLRKAGVLPILTRLPGFSKQYLGYATTTFFGGRTSAHIRKVAVPVVYTDFLSMYPTVNAVMGLWDYLIAQEIEVVPNCTAEIEEFLRTITLETLFNPKTWLRFPAFVRLAPNGDVLPTRAKYSVESNDYQVGLNHLYADDCEEGLWFALPDVIASVLLTGRIPKIIDAFRIVPRGQLPRLHTIKLRGTVTIDPRSQDLFRVIIEERKRLAFNAALSVDERKRLDKALKVLANATSYGIFAEMLREESEQKVGVTCYGLDATPFSCRVTNPEEPGEYCFPPLATLITAGARLMLAMLERCVTDLGGTYAMEDTDSMAIVATEYGGHIECPGGPYRKDGKPAIRALSWKQVEEIAELFRRLSPYSTDAIRGSILKIEDDNLDATTEQQRQLWCLAISAKRYALFVRDSSGEPTLLRRGVNNNEDRYSEHGLGHLLNPTNPESDDRSWIAQVWLNIVRRSLGISTKPLGFEKRVAVGRITVSSPRVLNSLGALNVGKTYAQQIKPFNFILSCHVAKLGHPVGVNPESFQLIAPYETDPRQWEQMHWIDQYSETAKPYRISTTAPHGSRTVARIKSYGDVLREYEYHPEAKCVDSNGAPCSKQTVGLLGRRHVAIDSISYIGKESNRLEEVEDQSLQAPCDVYTEYPDPRRDEWATKVLPMLKTMPLRELMERTGLPRSTLQAIRAGRRPHPKNATLLSRLLVR